MGVYMHTKNIYRLDVQMLLTILQGWNRFLKRKVHLVACGGTAMTLLGVKASTKDVDFMVPVASEYAYLVKTLKSLGYVPGSGAGWLKKVMDIYLIFFRATGFTQQNF